MATNHLINQSTYQPVNLSTSQLINYTLFLADNALILGQRNSEWCGHGPVLEQDIAITNISLDLIGQARNFYQYAASQIGGPATEDSLAYLRTEREFKNLLLVEQPNGDWAGTTLRQFFFSTYQYFLYLQLQNSTDEQLAAIAEKALKEVTYHLRWSSEWVIRLGDGTEESKDRMLAAIDELWPFTGELFLPSAFEIQVAKEIVGADVAIIQKEWQKKVASVFEEATLPLPKDDIYMQRGGKDGVHTEHLGYILAEMQYLQRTYPGCAW
ncbi:phenylacetate-CoA oxygenase subunit PaaC [Panacibacter ginsenosidivorans]|uniref:Phenylacetate-CoA oxygenase subunit PaaC n=1 Tax=Panacibacter ginsenosidivorans TaxID=1813871 RepID=A0A5B8V9L5_9BACT|nr:1,2-phenylacetyl-CoA epoxidase subunit PaaC [Panacibacter ginsenosidivorans]QEC67939.1 phenylacetate-CoA oxygenase subunit PaaC [Panacibacter ginsenosidivorans]